MKITTLVLVLACVVAMCIAKPRPAEEYEYEDEPAPSPKPAARPNPLLRRNPLNRGGPKSTTTTTTPTPLEDEELPEDGEIDEDQEVDLQPTTTTEAPKKKLRSGIRPFRSNDDLLAALKRRREQASNGKTHTPKVHETSEPEQAREESTPAPKRANGRRNRFNGAAKADEQEAESAPAPVPSRNGRRFSSRA